MTIPEFPSDIIGLGMYVIMPFVFYLAYRNRNRHKVENEESPYAGLRVYSLRLVFGLLSVFVIASVVGIILFYGDEEASNLAINLGMWLFFISWVAVIAILQYKSRQIKKRLQSGQSSVE